MAKYHWEKIYANGVNYCDYDGWLDAYADEIASTDKPVIELGVGGGNNLSFYEELERTFVACDICEAPLEAITKRYPGCETYCFDLVDGLPFPDASADVIVADLCLHYFTGKDTEYIVSEIYRTLTDGGMLFVRVNSTEDINHGANSGEEIEPGLRLMPDGQFKRFFTVNNVHDFFKHFTAVEAKPQIMNRYTNKKKVIAITARK